MADKQSNVVLNFKMEGQVEYANTIRDINAIMNAAAQEYRTHVAAMGKDADATQKLAAEKKKLEIQLEAGRKRTEQLRTEYEQMAKSTNTSAGQLANKYRQLQNSERAEIALERALDRVNEGLSEQAIESRKAEEALNKLESEAEGLERQTEKLNAEYELQVAQLGDNASEADKLRLKMDHLNESHELAREKVKNHEEQLEQARIKYGENSEEVDKYETQLLEARTAEQQLRNEIIATNKQLKEQKGVLEKTSKALEKTGDSLKSAGKTMTTRVTAPIVGVATAAFAAADSIDKAFREIRIGTGATGDDLEHLKDSFEVVFAGVPDDAEVVATALANLNTYTGWTGDTLSDLTRQVMDASRTMSEDGVAASTAFGKVLNAWNIEAEDAEGHLDHLYNLSQTYGVGIGELSSLITRQGTVLKNAGFEMDEVAHWMATLEANGLSVSRIMPGLNRATRNWADEGKNAKEELEKVIEQMKNATDETEALTIASEVFGAQGAQRMVDAVRNDALPAISDLGKMFDESSGIIAEATEDTRTIGEEFQILKNNTMTALQPLGEILLELARKAIPPLIDGVTKVAEWFKNLSPETQKMIVIIGGIAAAIGPVLVVLGMMIKSIGAIVGILPLLGKAIAVLTGPIGLIIGAVVALIAIFVRLYRNNEKFRDKVHEIWEKIKEYFSVALEFIKNIVHTVITAVTEFFGEQLKKIREFWEENGEQILEYVKMVFGNIWDQIKMVMGIIKGIFEIVWPIIVGVFKTAWNMIKTTVENGIDFVLGIINTVLAILRGDWEGAWNAIKETVENIWNNIKNFFENVDLIETGKNIINGLITGIGSMISSVGDAVKNIGKRIKDTFTNFFSIKSPSRVMRELGKNLTEGLGLGIEDEADFAVNKTENVAYRVSNAMNDGIELPDMEIGTVVRQPSNFRVNSSGFGGTSSNEYNYQTLNMDGLFNGAVFNVRDDNDIKNIAKELNDYIRMGARKNGVIML